MKELGLTFEILHDPRQVTTRNYQITGYPETFIIARDGTIRRKVIGRDDWSSNANRALVRELLGLAASTAPHCRASWAGTRCARLGDARRRGDARPVIA